jgi:hypothetical protein
MPSIEYRPDRPKPYRARYWAPDGKLHSRSFARKDDALRWLTGEEASKLKGSWIDPSRARQLSRGQSNGVMPILCSSSSDA